MSKESPLFSYRDHSQIVTWTHSSFVKYLKMCLGKIGLPISSNGLIVVTVSIEAVVQCVFKQE